VKKQGFFMRGSKLVLLGLVTACAGAADDSGEVVCTAEFVPAIEVRAVDARTGEPIADFSGWVGAGESRETFATAGSGIAHAAGEAPGTYAVHVSAPGYQPWDTAGVVASADECHVLTRRVEAMLKPLRS
jgi:hypothetical protein